MLCDVVHLRLYYRVNFIHMILLLLFLLFLMSLESVVKLIILVHEVWSSSYDARFESFSLFRRILDCLVNILMSIFVTTFSLIE